MLISAAPGSHCSRLESLFLKGNCSESSGAVVIRAERLTQHDRDMDEEEHEVHGVELSRGQSSRLSRHSARAGTQ